MRSGSKSRWAMACTCAASTALDPRDDFFDRQEIVEIHLLAGEVGHARVRAFETHQDVALELIFCAGEFLVAERRLLQTAEFRHDEVDHFERLAGGGSGIDAEGAGVAVGTEVGVDGVSHAALFANGLEEARTHAAAEHGIEDQRGVAIVVGNRRRGYAEAELHLLKRFLVLQQDACAGLRGLHLLHRLRRRATP